jgi:hypothetical protein
MATKISGKWCHVRGTARLEYATFEKAPRLEVAYRLVNAPYPARKTTIHVQTSPRCVLRSHMDGQIVL